MPLNPFILPAPTTPRFVLLVVSVVGASLFAFNIVYFSLVPHGSREYELYLRCGREPTRDGRVPDLDTVQGFAECVAPFERGKGLWILAGLVLLLMVAAATYWWLPSWRIRREHLAALTVADSPQIIAELTQLVQLAGLRRGPTFVVRMSSGSSGLAFGRCGRRYVRLDAGLIARYGIDRAGFCAIVLHELAHLRNKDVDKAYLTLAIWWAFLVVALAPLAASLADEPAATVLGVGVRMLALVGLVYLTGSAVLRTREVYADIRANQWEGPGGALRSVLNLMPKPTGRPWRTLAQAHPDPARRIELLDNTDRLFRPGFWEAFGTGLAVTIAYGNVVTLVWLLRGSLDPLGTRWLAAAVFAPLAMGIIGIALWRGAIWGRARGVPLPGVVPTGLGLGAGLAVGQFLSASSAITGSWGVPTGVGPAIGVLSIAAEVGVSLLLVGWLAGTISAWVRVLWARAPAPVYLAITAVASGLLALWLGIHSFLLDLQPMFAAQTALARADYETLGSLPGAGPQWLWLLVEHPLGLYLTYRNLLLVGLLALWLTPLAAWLVPRRTLPGPGYRSPDRALSPTPAAPPPRPGRRPSADAGLAVALGAVAAVCFGLVLLAIRVRLHRMYPAATRDLPEFAVLFNHWQIMLAILTQAATAAAMAVRQAIRRRPLAVPLGLLAAFVGAVLMTVAIVFAIGLGGCANVFSIRPGPCSWKVDQAFVQLTLRRVLIEGALLSIISGLVGAGIGGLLARAVRPAARTLPAARRPAWALLVPTGMAIVVLLILISNGGSPTPMASQQNPRPHTPASSSPPTTSPTSEPRDSNAELVCKLNHQILDNASSLTAAQLQDLLTRILGAARRSHNVELQDAVTSLVQSAVDNHPQEFVRNVDRINTLCESY
jgi:Zn-dependent protease with chaperone function